MKRSLIVLFNTFMALFARFSHEERIRSMTQRLLLPLALISLLMSVGVGALLYWQNRSHTQEMLQEKRKILSEQFASLLAQQAIGLGAAAKIVAADPQMRQSLAVSDYEALQRQWGPLYRQLNASHGLTHFYFFDTRRICLLRLHNPQKRGDLINRFTALEAEWRASESYGIELGPLGTLTLRYVTPIYEAQTLIGYVELGKEIEDLLSRLSTSFNAELFLLIKKSYLNQQDWEAGMAMLQRHGSWNEHFDTVVVYASSEAHRTQLDKMLEPDAKQTSYALNGHRFEYVHLGIFDVARKEIGALKVAVDVTQSHLQMRQLVLWSVLLGLSLSTGLVGLIYLLLRSVDQALLAKQQRLRESEGRFAQLTQFNRTVVWECDAKGLYTYISDSAYDILGYFPDEMIGHMHCYDLASEASGETLKTEMLERFAAQKPFRDFVASIHHQRGYLLWRSTSALPMLGADGAISLNK